MSVIVIVTVFSHLRKKLNIRKYMLEFLANTVELV